MSTPKRHHYLPRFYLGGFCTNDGFCVYDRENMQYRPQTPVNTALQTHYYSVEGVEGLGRTDIETSVLSEIDGLTKPIIEKLNAGEALTVNEKEELSIFIGLLMTRVPRFEEWTNTNAKRVSQAMMDTIFCNVERAQSFMNQRERNTGEKPTVSAQELVDFYRSGEYEIEIPRSISLTMMLANGMDLAHYFKQMDWKFLHAPNSTSFITTDVPVVLVPPADYNPNNIYEAAVGIITPGARKIVTLSQSTCLVMYDHGQLAEHHNITAQSTQNINVILAKNSDRLLIGRDEPLVRSVVEAAAVTKRAEKGIGYF
ncbi:DUF4238 domain-containing protein [Candidatus Poribacteria bacterium]|nr:DUF4238 domain-containing protein [Candidatus Poribacteria bacterium]